MFETRLTKFASENELSPDVVQDLIQIFNEALIEIGQGILNNTTKTQKTVNKTTTHIHKEVGQKWASKVAQGFAEEKELTLDDWNFAHDGYVINDCCSDCGNDNLIEEITQ